MQFSNTLKNRRNELHITQQQLADNLFVTRQTISRWENNLSYPNLDTLVEISDLLNLSLDELLRGDNNNMVDKISKDVRTKNTYKKYATISSTIMTVIIIILFILSWGRYTQNSTIDRINPFLSTQYGYGILPKNNHRKIDTFISDDPFGNGEWLNFKTGEYSEKNRWVIIAHKGSNVQQIRTVTYNEIPITLKKQVGQKYFKYNEKYDGPRISKRWRWVPFN